jgi:hypothetical protein
MKVVWLEWMHTKVRFCFNKVLSPVYFLSTVGRILGLTAKTRLLLFWIMLTALLSTASGANLCQSLFEIHSPPSTYYSRGSNYEFQYQSNGYTRYFKNGLIFQLTNNKWIPIGTAVVSNGQLYETVRSTFATSQSQNRSPSIPDLRSLRHYQTNVTTYFANIFFPNVGGTWPTQVHAIQIGSHQIQIQIPKDSGAQWAAQGIIDSVLDLPMKRIESLSVVRVNTRANVSDPYWRQKYKNFSQSAATAGNGQMDIYGVSIDSFGHGNNEAKRITRHEFGHLIASTLFGSPEPNQSYVGKASRDQFTVSEYGNNSWAEDFAEGIEFYLRTNAGQLSRSLRRNLSNRFDFFDDVFNYRSPSSVKKITEFKYEKPSLELFISDVDAEHFLLIAPEIGLGLLVRH